MAVQYSALRAGVGLPFRDYAILGDDLDITHPQVAGEYRVLMDALGVQISEAKSVVSDNRPLGFAKRIVWSGTEASPVSAKMVAGVTSPLLLTSVLQEVLTFRQIRLVEGLRLMGRGYRSASKVRAWGNRQRTGLTHNARHDITCRGGATTHPGMALYASEVPFQGCSGSI